MRLEDISMSRLRHMLKAKENKYKNGSMTLNASVWLKKDIDAIYKEIERRKKL